MDDKVRFGRFEFAITRPLVMAIINLTPDSFSGDGLAGRTSAAIDQAHRAVEEGADLIDIGGESSRPGADPVSVDEELERVIPLVQALAGLEVPISVDTMKPAVMRAATEAGASLINDINALRAPGALDVIANTDVGVCLMHMKGEPRTMQAAPQYTNVVGEVHEYLSERVRLATEAGVARERIVIDPGFGFGKSLEHNLALFKALGNFADLAPVLVGVSRKSMLGQITERQVSERKASSIAAAVCAAQRAAAIVRVHDVRDTVDALKVWSAINN